MARALLPKQKAFVEHYAACGNATEAARMAGYRTPNQQGAENLVKPGIQAALKAIADKVSSKRIADATERQEFWTAVMRGDKGHESEMKDRLKASELLGKVQQDFVDKLEVTHKDPPGVRMVVVHVSQS